MKATTHFYFDCGHHVTRFNGKPSNPWESIIKSPPLICRQCQRERNQKNRKPRIKSFQARLDEVRANKRLMKRPFVISEIESPEALIGAMGAVPIEGPRMLEDWQNFLNQENPLD